MKLFFLTLILFGLTACGQQQKAPVKTNDTTDLTSSIIVDTIVKKQAEAKVGTTENQADSIQAMQNQISDKNYEKVTFPSQDSLPITAHLFELEGDNQGVSFLLCHQAGSSKEEYNEIAPRLNTLGYNCLAIDQRAGGSQLGGTNETAAQAKSAGKSTAYLDAEQDIVAGIDYLFDKYKKPIILVGSSYSAALALKIGKEKEQIKAIVSFSPGEYFAKTKGKTFVQDAMKGIEKAVFLTSSREESQEVRQFLRQTSYNTPSTQYVPAKAGIHGARALWSSTEGSGDYWKALMAFLEEIE